MKNIVNFVCLICAQDGVISSSELKRLFDLLTLHKETLDLGEFSQEEFDELVVSFFSSTETLEDILSTIPKDKLSLIMWIAKESAEADELDIRENIEYDRALKISNISIEEEAKWNSMYS
tara:strand:- start:3582 stop:3941 length:360 start_codon:yes stop_codon:yes gene_type:complete